AQPATTPQQYKQVITYHCRGQNQGQCQNGIDHIGPRRAPTRQAVSHGNAQHSRKKGGPAGHLQRQQQRNADIRHADSTYGLENPYLDNVAAPWSEAKKSRNAWACAWRPSRLTRAIGYSTGVGEGSVATTLTLSGMMAASVANT